MPSDSSDALALRERHADTLKQALDAIHARGYWSAYPEIPSGRIYGEDAAEAGKAAFQAHLGREFDLDQPAADGAVGAERSPYGLDLGIRYPRPDVEALLAAMSEALPAWRDAGAEARAGVCLEILARLNRRSFEMAHAVMHTTGQAFVMAFQAGGPHAQDRALEAIAYAYAEMTRHAQTAVWEKPQGKREPLRMTKSYAVVPRGISLTVACRTFPTWNSYPGIFASLVTGNPVLVKPHPDAILPLAITVAAAREVLAEAGFDPNLVCLAPEDSGQGLASGLATSPQVRIVDFTGSKAYGQWLEEHARQALVFTEKSGVNSVVIDSIDDLDAMAANIAFSLALYSGQMCTAPQNLLIPRQGIGTHTFDEVVAAIGDALGALLADDARAVEIAGAVVGADVLARLERAPDLGRVLVESRRLAHPQFPEATVRTPALVGLDAAADDVYASEHFGPIAFAIATNSTEHSLQIWSRTAAEQGAITASVYSTDEAVLQAAERIAQDVGVALSCNLTDGVYVNQSAAFSDFHATGANPAANACFTDAAFVAGRFRVVQSRRHHG